MALDATQVVGGTCYIYQASSGHAMQVFLIPTVGFGLFALGRYCNLARIEAVGNAILKACHFGAPGTIVGYTTYALLGKTFTATTIGTLLGIGASIGISHFR